MSKENLKTTTTIANMNSPRKLECTSKPPRPHAARSVRFESTTTDSPSFREIIAGSGRSSSMRRSSSPPPLGWSIKKPATPRRSVQDASPITKQSDHARVDNSLELMKKQNLNVPEMELMKERFAKLLLGEDMSGSGKGVCTALGISNAITNLCATVFGQLWRLEPLPPEKKSMWKREMEWLLCASDHIVELIPSWQTFSDGNKLEVMTCRPRSDIHLNLPALRKLDNMLQEILESFSNTEFWYVDQGVMAAECDGSTSFRRTSQREEDKWWLPVPRVPAGGLRETSRKQLDHKRECTNQILKAAVAINSSVLADMEIPESFLEALPKNGRACLGDMIYRYITSEHFSPDCLLDCLDLSSDHVAVEIANRVEAAIFMWRRRHHNHHYPTKSGNGSRSSWMMVRDFVAVDGDKREVVLADRAERLLLCLKQRCPGLTQTALDTSKIQFNKDVGKSILESYSRVLESLAFNIVARIDDLLYVDDLTKCTDRLTSVKSPGPTVSTMTQMKKKKMTRTPDRRSSAADVASVPHSGVILQETTRTTTPSVKDDNISVVDNQPLSRGGGLGVRRVLSNYLGGDMKLKQIHEGSRSSTDNKENVDPQRALTSSSPLQQGLGGGKSTSKRH